MIDLFLSISICSFVFLIKYLREESREDFWLINKSKLQELEIDELNKKLNFK